MKDSDVVMYNPVLLAKDTPYEAEEGCLSLDGTRKATRYQNIVCGTGFAPGGDACL